MEVIYEVIFEVVLGGHFGGCFRGHFGGRGHIDFRGHFGIMLYIRIRSPGDDLDTCMAVFGAPGAHLDT